MKNRMDKIIRWQKGLLATALMTMASGAWASDAAPAELIEKVANTLLEQIDQRRDEFNENPKELHDLVRQHLLPLLDQTYSARLILGRHGRGIPAEKINEFALALSNALTDRYSTGLLNFRSKEQMELLPANPNDNERLTRVRTRIKLTNGGSTPLDYAFRKTDEGWKVFDVTVEGVSYVMTFRNQLGPQVASQGIDVVTAELKAGNLEVSGP